MARWQSAPTVEQSQPARAGNAPAWASAPTVDDAMPASESMPATDPIAKMLGLSLNQQQGIPAAIRNSFTASLGDEISQGASWLGKKLGLHDEDPEAVRDEERRKLEEYRQAHPGQALGVEIVGGLPTAVLPLGALTRGASLGKRTLQGMKIGGGYGAVTGFGSGEGIEDRLGKAATGTATGALLGGATVPVLDVAGKVAKAVTAPVRGYLMPARTAQSKVSESFGRDAGEGGLMQPAKSATRRLAGDPNAMLVDLGGENVRGLVKAATNMPNAQRDIFARKLNQRQAGQVARFSTFIRKELGSPDDYDAWAEKLMKDRSAAAGPAFKQAFSQPPVSTNAGLGKIASLLSTPLGKTLKESAMEYAANKQRVWKTMPATEMLHFVKMQVDKMIETAKRGQLDSGAKKYEFNLLVDWKRRLMSAIDNQDYKNALKKFSDDSKPLTAMERGARHFESKSAGEIVKTLNSMSPIERRFYMLGGGKKVTEIVRGGNKMHDRVKRNFMDKSFMDKTRLLMSHRKHASGQTLPTGYRNLQKMVNVEGRQADTRRAVQGNSTTAKQIAEMDNASQEAETVVGAAQGLMDPSSIMGFIGRQTSRLTGLTPRVAEEILRIVGAKPAHLSSKGHGLNRPMTSRDLDIFLNKLQQGGAWKRFPPGTYDKIVRALVAVQGQAAGR